ncbi:MAG: hypothetical protein A3H25_05870 [Sphingomonadales bacterium RIFCSPLOWO2_12_FULL_63_15]|nr:MAG: hypothetical protein A3H25_05870 [Sphingomonadales bacterium RIFCSPLOWO2_12_FULL_63_15]
MIFDSWAELLRVVALGAAAYLALVTTLRISGKRTLAKMNAFDLVVTVALGSTLATILLSKDVALVEGVVAFLLLVGLQYLIAALSVRFPWIENLAKSEPRALLYNGVPDEAALRQERVTQDELLSAVRAAGFGGLDLVAAVVLETDGNFSVVSRDKVGSRSAIPMVKGVAT